MDQMSGIHSQPNICTIVTNSGNTINCRFIDGVALMDTASVSRQHFQSAAWLDPQLNRNNNYGHAAAWNQSHRMPYVQAPNVNASLLENASMGLQRYLATTDNRRGLRIPHPSPVNPMYLRSHHLTLPVQGMRGHSINFHPQVTAASYRDPTNPPRNAAIPTQNGFEMATRHVDPALSAGLQIYQTHRGGIPETSVRHGNNPPTGFLQVNDVALLVDHHSGRSLDIEDMSYEELIALGERIGNASSGVSEEMITSQMKTKIYVILANVINLEDAASEEQDTDLCIICQDEYKNGEKIGVLQCSHEFCSGWPKY